MGYGQLAADSEIPAISDTDIGAYAEEFPEDDPLEDYVAWELPSIYESAAASSTMVRVEPNVAVGANGELSCTSSDPEVMANIPASEETANITFNGSTGASVPLPTPGSVDDFTIVTYDCELVADVVGTSDVVFMAAGEGVSFSVLVAPLGLVATAGAAAKRIGTPTRDIDVSITAGTTLASTTTTTPVLEEGSDPAAGAVFRLKLNSPLSDTSVMTTVTCTSSLPNVIPSVEELEVPGTGGELTSIDLEEVGDVMADTVVTLTCAPVSPAEGDEPSDVSGVSFDILVRARVVYAIGGTEAYNKRGRGLRFEALVPEFSDMTADNISLYGGLTPRVGEGINTGAGQIAKLFSTVDAAGEDAVFTCTANSSVFDVLDENDEVVPLTVTMAVGTNVANIDLPAAADIVEETTVTMTCVSDGTGGFAEGDSASFSVVILPLKIVVSGRRVNTDEKGSVQDFLSIGGDFTVTEGVKATAADVEVGLTWAPSAAITIACTISDEELFTTSPPDLIFSSAAAKALEIPASADITEDQMVTVECGLKLTEAEITSGLTSKANLSVDETVSFEVDVLAKRTAAVTTPVLVFDSADDVTVPVRADDGAFELTVLNFKDSFTMSCSSQGIFNTVAGIRVTSSTVSVDLPVAEAVGTATVTCTPDADETAVIPTNSVTVSIAVVGMALQVFPSSDVEVRTGADYAYVDADTELSNGGPAVYAYTDRDLTDALTLNLTVPTTDDVVVSCLSSDTDVLPDLSDVTLMASDLGIGNRNDDMSALLTVPAGFAEGVVTVTCAVTCSNAGNGLLSSLSASFSVQVLTNALVIVARSGVYDEFTPADIVPVPTGSSLTSGLVRESDSSLMIGVTVAAASDEDITMTCTSGSPILAFDRDGTVSDSITVSAGTVIGEDSTDITLYIGVLTGTSSQDVLVSCSVDEDAGSYSAGDRVSVTLTVVPAYKTVIVHGTNSVTYDEAEGDAAIEDEIVEALQVSAGEYTGVGELIRLEDAFDDAGFFTAACFSSNPSVMPDIVKVPTIAEDLSSTAFNLNQELFMRDMEVGDDILLPRARPVTEAVTIEYTCHIVDSDGEPYVFSIPTTFMVEVLPGAAPAPRPDKVRFESSRSAC